MLHLRLFLAVLIALLAVACTPSHTADTTAHYARQLGFTDRFDIKRWHNRQFAKDSRILVSLSAETDLDAAEITRAVAKSLSANFAAVDAFPEQQGTAKSRQLASRDQYQFLLDISRVAWTRTPPASVASTESVSSRPMGTERAVTVAPPVAPVDQKAMGQGEPGDDQGPPKIDSIEIEMRLLDVVSNTTMDKIVIVAAPAWTRDDGGRIDQLLGAAVTHLGNQLAGP